MIKKLFVLSVACALMSGCATIHRHPLATKIAFISAGAIAGGTLGYMQLQRSCSYMYEGKPYSGTTCPAPRESLERH